MKLLKNFNKKTLFPNVSYVFEMILDEMAAYALDFWYTEKYWHVVRRQIFHLKSSQKRE